MTSRHGTLNLIGYPHVQDMNGVLSSSRSSTRFPRGFWLSMFVFLMLKKPFPVALTTRLFFANKRGQIQDRSARSAAAGFSVKGYPS